MYHKKIHKSSLFILNLLPLFAVPFLAISCSSKENTPSIPPTNNDPSLGDDNNVENKNLKFGLEISGKNKYTNKDQSNDQISFDQAISNAQKYINDSLTEDNVKLYLNTFINIYMNSFKNQNSGILSYEIKEFNIKLNNQKQINGNIKVAFAFNQDLNTSLVAATRKAGDIEIHNFIFENSNIIPYINTSITNFLSFKIPLKYLQKQLISKSNPSNNFNVGITNQFVYLDDINELTIEINNSIFNIDIDYWIHNNMYLYSISNSSEKEIIEEVMKKIFSKKAKLLVSGKNPYSGQSTLSSPYLVIELDKIYDSISQEFLKELTWELGTIFNFVSNLLPARFKDNKIYIQTQNVLQMYKENTIYDFSTSNMNKDIFREMQSFNFFHENIQIKNNLINNKKNTINLSWFNFLKSKSDKEKANLIYEWLLPYVSYGQLNNDVSKIGGYIDGKVLCQGYTMLFNYFANILQIKSISIIGLVKTGAVPGQTESQGKHAWNLICINGSWLWCDSTWDDSMQPGSLTYNDDYFLKPTSEFFTDSTHLSIENWNNGALLPKNIK